MRRRRSLGVAVVALDRLRPIKCAAHDPVSCSRSGAAANTSGPAASDAHRRRDGDQPRPATTSQVGLP